MYNGRKFLQTDHFAEDGLSEVVLVFLLRDGNGTRVPEVVHPGLPELRETLAVHLLVTTGRATHVSLTAHSGGGDVRVRHVT